MAGLVTEAVSLFYGCVGERHLQEKAAVISNHQQDHFRLPIHGQRYSTSGNVVVGKFSLSRPSAGIYKES